MKNIFGKYRALVFDTKDPLSMGRIKVMCPRIYGESESPWCLPCVPFGVTQLPQVDQTIWIEFEEGDTERPVYTGGWYLEGALKDLDPKSMYLNTKGDFIVKSGKVNFNDN